MHCFAGCDVRAITAALGLRVGDLFAGQAPGPRFVRPLSERERAFYDVLQAERAHQAKRDAAFPLTVNADLIKELRGLAADLRAIATELGDTEQSWWLLKHAAHADTEAERLDA